MDKNIVFIGMPGSGKTTTGKAIAKKLNLSFYDIDECIENREGMSIKEIFVNGEDYFRNVEAEVIKETSMLCPCIISTGGGSVKVPSNMENLKKNSIIFFINRPIENIIKDIDITTRPLLAGDISKTYNLYKERYPLYKKYCNIEVMNDTSLEEFIERVYNHIKNETVSKLLF